MYVLVIVWTKIKATVESAEKAAPKPEPAPKPHEPLPPAPTPKATSKVATTTSAATDPTASAPKLKLKLGSGQSLQNGDITKPAPKVKPLHKSRKPKATTDMPPPPYIDDGSHDLLQEVIAMEELEKAPNKASGSKRKHIEMEPEDELLDLADTTSHTETDRHPIHEKPRPTIPPLVSHSSTSSLPKIKKIGDKSAQSHAQVVPPNKGKERESTSTPGPSTPSTKPKKAATPSGSTPPAATPINEKKCKEVLKSLLAVPQSFIFANPVDPIRDGCPT